jgi:AcrR family transcriptional regulator
VETRDLRRSLVEAASAMLRGSRRAPAPSLRAVARACGVSATAVYRYFDSGTALIDAVLDLHFAEVREHVEAASAVSDPRRRLTARAVAYVTWGVEHPGRYQVLFENDDRTFAWERDLAAAMAGDLLATESVRSTSAAIVLVDRLLIALHGIVAVRRHRSGRVWPRTAAEDTEAMVRIFLTATE